MSLDDVTRFSRLDLSGRRVLVRLDMDQPLTRSGKLTSERHLRRVAPVLAALSAVGARVVLAGHASTPHGLPAVAQALTTWSKRPIAWLGSEFWTELRGMAAGDIAIAPNLASYPEEAANDADWAKKLARHLDVYVAEAPRAARETRASTVALPRLLPARGVGPIWGADLDMARDFLELPTPPYVAVVGGQGVLRKAAFLEGLLGRVDALLLGGVVANTFLVAAGVEMQASSYELDAVPTATRVLQTAREKGTRLLLPRDGMVLDRDAELSGALSSRSLHDLEAHEAVLDLGAQTRDEYLAALAEAETVLFSGLLGSEQHAETLNGTRAILEAAAARAPYFGIVGERSLEVASQWGVSARARHLAVGGDATLELLGGTSLPGVDSLRQTIPEPSEEA